MSENKKGARGRIRTHWSIYIVLFNLALQYCCNSRFTSLLARDWVDCDDMWYVCDTMLGSGDVAGGAMRQLLVPCPGTDEWWSLGSRVEAAEGRVSEPEATLNEESEQRVASADAVQREVAELR